jgi:hypothetical protein
MEQILYLGHTTILENLENILESEYLFTSYERKKLNIAYPLTPPKLYKN